MSSRDVRPGTTRRKWHPSRALGALLLTIFAVTLTGCAWTGKGRDVVDAMQKTDTLTTATFSGSIVMDTQVAGAGQRFEATFVGADDSNDPAHAKTSMDMTIENQRMRVVAPGDGNMYIETQTGAYGAPVGASASENQAELGAVLAALESAIGNFRDGGPMTTNEGAQLRSVIADGKVDKICADVVPAFSSTMNAASSDGGALKELGGDASDICRRMLQEKPTLWFGIDDSGYLRMIAVEARLTVLGLGRMKMTMRFDITSMNKPVKISKPNGARLLASQAELQQRIAVDAAR